MACSGWGSFRSDRVGQAVNVSPPRSAPRSLATTGQALDGLDSLDRDVHDPWPDLGKRPYADASAVSRPLGRIENEARIG
jgi:hypothetical protein